MEFIEEWFLNYWKQPDHWIVSQNHCIFGWYLGFKTFYLSLKVVGDGWVALVILLSTKVQIFAFLDLRLLIWTSVLTKRFLNGRNLHTEYTVVLIRVGFFCQAKFKDS